MDFNVQGPPGRASECPECLGEVGPMSGAQTVIIHVQYLILLGLE